MQKILSPLSLLGINIAIIVAAQLLGGGMMFFNTGIIHGIALLFIVLVIIRIFNRPNIYDPILGSYTLAAIVAMAIFAAAHSVELLRVVVFKSQSHVSYANMINLILLAVILVALAIGAEAFIWRLERRGRLILNTFAILLSLLLVVASYVVLNPNIHWLPAGSPQLYVYAAATTILCALVLWKILQVRGKVVFMGGFTKYLVAAVILIDFNMIANIFHEQLQTAGVPEHQLIYFNHFIFYIVLSMFFLSFSQLRHLGGILDEITAKNAQVAPIKTL